MKPQRYRAPAEPRPGSAFDGVLLVDKPAGPTSHDVVALIRRTFRIRKVGHGGTLDPQAEGLLVLLLGRATKLSDRFLASDKEYEGTLRLGTATDSQDAQGNILREADYGAVTREAVEDQMRRREGDQFQTPPMVSAVKVDGVPLYKRARKGQTVERKPRFIHVYRFALEAFEPPDARFRLRCTKGTYVRTLCADIGEALGCGAHLSYLRRTRSGELRLDRAQPLDRVLAMSQAELQRCLLPLYRFMGQAPA